MKPKPTNFLFITATCMALFCFSATSGWATNVGDDDWSVSSDSAASKEDSYSSSNDNGLAIGGTRLHPLQNENSEDGDSIDSRVGHVPVTGFTLAPASTPSTEWIAGCHHCTPLDSAPVSTVGEPEQENSNIPTNIEAGVKYHF